MPSPTTPSGGSGFRDTFKTLGGVGTVGMSFVFAIFIGAGAGYFLMTRFGLGRWVFFVGFIFGVVAGVLNVYRTASRYLK
jgi:F0F1-type ATP synthase assembly protein I